MYDFITVPLTSLVLLKVTQKRKNIDSKIANVTTCKVVKNYIMNVSGAILIKYSN